MRSTAPFQGGRTEEPRPMMRIRVLCVSAFAAMWPLVLIAAPLVDDPPAEQAATVVEEAASPQAALVPASDPEAVAWIEKAIDAQKGRGLRGAIRDLRTRFDVISYEDGNRIELNILQSYRIDPSRDPADEWYASRVEDKLAREAVTKGFDGRRYWLKEKRLSRHLKGREDRRDIEKIEEEISRIRETLQLFFLENLLGGEVALLSHEDASAPKDSVAIRRVAKDARDIVLYIDKKSERLVRALLPAVEGRDSMRIDFSKSRARVFRDGKEDKDLFVPKQMLIYHGGATKPTEDFFLNELRVNGGIEPSEFTLDAN